MHTDPLFGSLRIRWKRLPECANPTAGVPAIVDHTAMRTAVAAKFREIEMNIAGDLSLAAPSLHDSINTKTLVAGGSSEFVRGNRRTE